MRLTYSLPWLCILGSVVTQAELVSMDESSMESVSGQTGIGVNIEKLVSIGSVTYSDDDGASGGDLAFSDIKIGHPDDVANQLAFSQHLVNVDGTGGLFIDSLFEPTRIQVGGISVGSHIGLRSMGEFIFDFEGTNLLQIGGTNPTGYLISSETHFTNVSTMWTTNGNTLRMDNMTIDSVLTDAVFEEKLIDATTIGLVIDIPSYEAAVSIGSVCFTATACDANSSFGSFDSSLALVNSQLQIRGGGREGHGITMNMVFEFDDTVNASGDGNYSAYTDEDTIKFAKMSGSTTVTGFTFDIGTAEANIGDHIATQFDRLQGSLTIGDISIAGNSIGSLALTYDFADGTHDSVLYQNKRFIAPGVAFAGQDFAADTVLANAGFDSDLTNFYSKVDSTSDGISLYSEWHLTASATYTDDANPFILHNYTGYGSGYVTLDVRSGDQSIDSSNSLTDGFLAIGIRDFKVNYEFDGFKATDTSNQLQSGYEFLGISPDARFTLNAGVEIRSGGASGAGVTFDGDVFITEGNFAVTKSILNYEDGNDTNDRAIGVYLDGVEYEYHFRDVTLDVDTQGIQLVLGEMWASYTIGDVRFGDRDTGDSLGALVIQTYQSGSTVSINGGGAGTQCVSGSGADSATCEASGGYWIDGGTQGLTIASKSILNQRSGAKENSATWETNRSGGINTGTAMKLDNIYTSDGYDDTSNAFGVQSSMSVDIAKVRVLKKDTGLDGNGVNGSEGDELITDGTGGSYTYITVPTDADKANRPDALVLTNNVQVKELNIDQVQMLHHSSGSTDTMLNGIKLQNLNMTSTLSVTPIR